MFKSIMQKSPPFSRHIFWYLIVILNLLIVFNSNSQIVINTTIFKNGYNITPFFLLHNSDYGVGVSLSQNKTNSVGIGVAFAAINEKSKLSFYSGTVSLRYGKNINVINTNYPIYTYFESGACIDAFYPEKIYNQSVLGLNVSRAISERNRISLGGGIGYNTKWSGDFFYILTCSINF